MEHLALTGDRLKRGFAEGRQLFFRRRSYCFFLCMINSFVFKKCRTSRQGLTWWLTMAPLNFKKPLKVAGARYRDVAHMLCAF